MPGSGKTALETSALSLVEPGERVLVVVAGHFGILMREIMKRDRRRGNGVHGGVGPADRPRQSSRRRSSASKPKVVTLVHNETSTGTTYPAAEVGRMVKRHGALFLLDTVSSLAGHRRADRRVGRGPQHDGLPEMPRRAARHGDRRRGPRRPGKRWSGGSRRPPRGSTTSCAGARSGSRSPAAGKVPDGAQRRAAHVDADPSDAGARRRGEAGARGRPAPPLPPPRRGGPCLPRGARRHAARDVPATRRSARTPSPASRRRNGIEPAAVVTHMRERLRHPDRHRAR